MELLTLRTCFDPTQPAPAVAAGWSTELEYDCCCCAWEELRAAERQRADAAEAARSRHAPLSSGLQLACVVATLRAETARAWRPLSTRARADIRRTMSELVATCAAEEAGGGAMPPFSECTMQLEYLASVNNSLRGLVDEQAGELTQIREHISLRERERARAVERLSGWRFRCAEADKEVADACRDGFDGATMVDAFLRTVDPVIAAASAGSGGTVALARELSAEAERIGAAVQQARNATRAAGDEYGRVAAGRRETAQVLGRMQRVAGEAADGEARLLTEVEALRTELASCRQCMAEQAAEAARVAEENAALRAAAVARPQPRAAAASPSPRGAAGIEGQLLEGLEERAAGDGVFVVSAEERSAMLHVIQQHRALLAALSPNRRRAASSPPATELAGLVPGVAAGGAVSPSSGTTPPPTDLTTAQHVIQQQQQEVADLRRLVAICMNLRHGEGDDAIRALVDSSPLPVPELSPPRKPVVPAAASPPAAGRALRSRMG